MKPGVTKTFVGKRIALWVLLVGFLLGCSNRVVFPNTARLSISRYDAEFPFELTVNAYQIMRFNAHTFSFGNERVPVTYRLFLKRDSGTLRSGEFRGVADDALLQGRITIRGGQVIIDIDQGFQHEPRGAVFWSKADLNGTYALSTGN